MDPATFLIKCAVTTAALANVAKSNGIPLLGDWRYAARLLHKAKTATPVGQQHYQRVLGFINDKERNALTQMYRKLPATGRDTELGINYSPRGQILPQIGSEGTLSNGWRLPSKTKAQLQKEREAISKQQMNCLRVGAAVTGGDKEKIQQAVVKLQNGLIEPMNERAVTKNTQRRTVHTHPSSTDLSQIAFRNSSFGHVFPSSLLDREEHRDKVKSLSHAIDLTKKHLTGIEFKSTIGSTNSIVNPETGYESVTKMGPGVDGEMKRMYFRRGDPIK